MEKQTIKAVFDAAIHLLTSNKEAQIIALFCFIIGLAAAWSFYTWSARSLKDIFLRSFLDPRGAADFKAITVFIFVAVFVGSIPAGIVSGKWIPDSYLNYLFLTIWIGFGADAAQNIQMMRTEKKEPETIAPAVQTETIENLTINEPIK